MPAYKTYPTVKMEKKRKARKRARREVFEYNKSLTHRLRRERRDARKEK